MASAQEVMTVNSLSVHSKESELVSVDSNGKAKSITPTKQSARQKIAAVAQIGPGERIRVSGEDPAELIISEAVTAHLSPGTEIEIPKVEKQQKPTASLKLLKGKMFIRVDAEKLSRDGNVEFSLETPKSLLAVRGTKFVAASADQSDSVVLLEGSVAVRDQATKEFVTLRPGQATTVSGEGKLQARRPTQEESLYTKVFEETELTFVPYRVERDSLSTAKTEFADGGRHLEANYSSTGIFLSFTGNGLRAGEGVYHLAFKPRHLRIDPKKVVGLIVGVRTYHRAKSGPSLEPMITFNLECTENALLTGSAKIPVPVNEDAIYGSEPKTVRTFFVPAGLIEAGSSEELETWKTELGAEIFAEVAKTDGGKGKINYLAMVISSIQVIMQAGDKK